MLSKKDYSGKSFVNPYKRYSIQNVTKKRFFRVLKKIVALFFILLILAAVYITFFSGVLKVRSVVLSGEFQQSNYEQYHSRVAERVSGENLLFFQTNEVKELFSGDNFVSVAVERIFPNTINVTIHERLPLFQIQRGSESFLADEEGFVLSKGSDSNLVLIELPTSTPALQPKAFVLSKGPFLFFQGLIKGMKEENNVKIAKFMLRSKELADFNVFSQKSWFMVVDAQKDSKTYVEALKTFLQEKYAIENTLTYIDLRIQDRIYYK